jgi:hypothetical protein
MSTSVPSARTLSVQTSHIWPGPYLGYWNSSMRLVTWAEPLRRPANRARMGSQIASKMDMPLMRCAPQSAEMADAGTPQTFSL